MQIVRLERRRTRPPKVRVTCDDGTQTDVSDEVIAAFRLSTGDEITPPKWLEIQIAHQRIDAKRLAINFLSYRPRSSQEVVRYLVGKHVASEVAEETASRLRALKMIDDGAFARMYVRDRLRRGGYGPSLLREQLVRKGISRRSADAVIEELLSVDTQRAAAVRLVRQRSGRSVRRSDTPERRRQRMYELLLRKGFSGEIARSVLRELSL